MQQDARPERIPIRGARAHDAKVGRGARTEPKTSLNKGQKNKKPNSLAAHQRLLFPRAVFSL